MGEAFLMGQNGKSEQSKTVTPNTAGFTVSPDAGKTLSSVVINGDTDLIPANIKSGVIIFGVTGTLAAPQSVTVTCDVGSWAGGSKTVTVAAGNGFPNFSGTTALIHFATTWNY